MTDDYVHGYDVRENLRLQDQASTLAELLHPDTSYPPGSRVLSAPRPCPWHGTAPAPA